MAFVVELLVLELVHHFFIARSLFPADVYKPLVGHRIPTVHWPFMIYDGWSWSPMSWSRLLAAHAGFMIDPSCRPQLAV